MAELAAEAEVADWDGVFYYDAVAIGGLELYDPWIVLAAMAMTTSRVTLGLMVAAPARRRPWLLAREAMTVDELSRGRLVLPVGIGALDDAGFGNVGEPVSARERAAILDETLAIVDGLWSGEPFAWQGTHYRFDAMTFKPRPVQQPRIPIWSVASWPQMRTIKRAARWDGAVIQNEPVEDVRRVVDELHRERASNGVDGEFQYVVNGTSDATDPAAAARQIEAYAAVGATWWVEADWQSNSVKSVRARIAAGPPRIEDTTRR